jgi:hypothetical protein
MWRWIWWSRCRSRTPSIFSWRTGRNLSVPLRCRSGRELAPFLTVEKPGPLPARMDRQYKEPRTPNRRFPGRDQRRPASRHRLQNPHRGRRADARGNADKRIRIVPRFGVAAGHAHAASRARRALRFRLPHPAQARRGIARRSERRRGGLHRPPRVGGGLSARRRLDRARPDLRPARRRGASAARLLAGTVQRRARHRRRGAVRIDDGARDEQSRASTNRRARPFPIPRINGARSSKAAA